MKKVLIFYGILVIVIVVFAVTRGANLLNFNFGGGSSAATAKVGNKTYNVTVAKTDKEKMQGLSGKNSLPANTGLLFVFEQKGQHAFWMNGMKFPIDIIFINDNKVVDIVENAPAPAQGQAAGTLPIYKPSSDVNYVLEVNAKEVSKNKLKTGDTVELKNIK